MRLTAMKTTNYIRPLNRALDIFFKDALKISLKDPSQARYFLQTVKNQQKAARIRAVWNQQGLHVPPMMIMSITNRCNLQCQGCYHMALRDIRQTEMSSEMLRSTIAQASELGISFIILAGGEPLVRQDIVDITADFPNIIFLLFTNGLLIDDTMISRFKTQKNIVPLISLEGFQSDTDQRRGNDVFTRLVSIIRKLNEQNIFYGSSLTVTSTNFSTLSGDDYVRFLSELNCKMFFFVEYAPVHPGTELLTITEPQRQQLAQIMQDYRRRFSALFISVPGDEKDFGGCLSAGRGFVHISAEGAVEPCPFVPCSDAHLQDKTLGEALQSPLLKAIRESNEPLETGGSCALFARKDWVQSLINSSRP
ncbi:MAG TPA: radical SAM protein [Dehalococcoidales bacterium]|nr:radical SAM protein [Dehalococcoidales bacterium]